MSVMSLIITLECTMAQIRRINKLMKPDEKSMLSQKNRHQKETTKSHKKQMCSSQKTVLFFMSSYTLSHDISASFHEICGFILSVTTAPAYERVILDAGR